MKVLTKLLPYQLKQIIKSIINYAQTKALEIKRIELIRSYNKKDLLDQKLVERLLCELGLNNEELFNYPKSLYEFCGKGLLSWQYPIQFGKYLIELANRNVQTYLEIGIKHGGTFIITVEYLRRFNSINKAIGIDLFPVKGLKAYKTFNKQVKGYAMNSRSEEFKEMIIKHGPFDLVLIDGDHSYEGCLSDFITVRDHSRMIAFHDIVGMGVPGVIQLWNELKKNHSDDYDFLEFVEQYNEVTENTGKTWLGIGLAIKK